MTTMSNHPTTAYLAPPNAAKTSVRGEEPERLHPAVLARAKKARAEALAQSQVAAAVCFLAAAILAVFSPEGSTGFMVAFLATAVVAAGTRRWMAARRYAQEIARGRRREKNRSDHATDGSLVSMER